MNLLPYVPFAIVILLSLVGMLSSLLALKWAPSRLLRLCWAVFALLCVWIVCAAFGSIDALVQNPDNPPLNVFDWNVRFPALLAMVNLLLNAVVYIIIKPQAVYPIRLPQEDWGEVEHRANKCLNMAFTRDEIKQGLRNRLNVNLNQIVESAADPKTFLEVVDWCRRNNRTRELVEMVTEERPNSTDEHFHWLREWLKKN